MIKIKMPLDEPSSITFQQAAINLLDKALAEPAIAEIGIKSRGILVACIVLSLKEKFTQLSRDLQESFEPPAERPEQQGVYFKPNMDQDVERMANSKVAYNLVAASKPALIIPSVRHLLAELNPRYRQASSIFEVTLDDLRTQYQKLLNQKRRD